jgi:hypothetical protein
MADKESKVVEVAEESQAVKNLLSVIEALGDTMSVADRAKYDDLLARARAADKKG